jgi:hypothetical protein
MGQPKLDVVPLMMRRRAGRLARIGLHVALSCTGNPMPAVFCSRHGEIHRSVELLSALAQGEAMSPTSFGLSVHNAIGGLYSIIYSSHEPVTAISGGAESVGFGLLEASGMLAAGADNVLFVVYDEPLPEPYKIFRDEVEHEFGWAWLMVPPEAEYYSLTWEKLEISGKATCPEEPLGLRLMRVFLCGSREETLPSRGCVWHWKRHG